MDTKDGEGGIVKPYLLSACPVPPRSGGAIAVRDKIKSFSTKSRRRLIKVLCKFPHSWKVRFELGFADDVMEGKTVEERAKYSYYVSHRTQDLIKARYQDLQIVYKREWQERKSGRNQGELCPHYHFVAYGPRWTDEQYLEMFTHVALKWISYTKTEEIKKAVSVAMHRDSFGYLKENDRYASYFAKYVSKKSTIEGEAIGRFWGTIGSVEQSEGEEQTLTDVEAIELKRFLRRYLHSSQKRKKRQKDGSVILVRPGRRYEKALRRGRFSGFVAISHKVMRRFIERLKGAPI